MFKDIFKLINFKKVYPLALLNTILLFCVGTFLYQSNSSSAGVIFSVVGLVLSLLLFMFFYAGQAQVIGDNLISRMQGEEAQPVRKLINEHWKEFVPATMLVLVVAGLMYQLIIPLIGSIAGGIFQISIGTVELNILTLILNLMLITWAVFGIVAINTIGIGFKDTFSYVMNFTFTNFRRVVAFLVLFILTMFVMAIIAFFTASIFLIPIRILVYAYLIGLVNVLATGVFIENVSDEDFAPAPPDIVEDEKKAE